MFGEASHQVGEEVVLLAEPREGALFAVEWRKASFTSIARREVRVFMSIWEARASESQRSRCSSDRTRSRAGYLTGTADQSWLDAFLLRRERSKTGQSRQRAQ